MPLLPQRANTADNKEGLDDRSPIPAGDYLMHIVKGEMKETKAKTGHRLVLQFKVLEGDKKGRVVFVGLNLDNPNPIAVEIANKELNSICQACGKEGVEDSDELLQIPMMCTVTIKEGDANWAPSNEIKSYKSEGSTGGMVDPSADTVSAESDSVDGEKAMPWEEK